MSEADLQRQIDALRRQLGEVYCLEVPVFVPLATPLTSTSYDFDDTIAVGDHTIDTSAVFSAPAGIRAAVVHISCVWASASGSNYMLVGSTASNYVAELVADTTGRQCGTWTIPCNADGDFVVSVAGADATLVHMRIGGYWI